MEEEKKVELIEKTLGIRGCPGSTAVSSSRVDHE